MGRLIRIAIYALVILVLYFWITAWLKSYKDDAIRQQAEQVFTDTTAVDSLALVASDSLSLADSLHAGDTSIDAITNEQIVDGKVSYSDLDKKIEKVEKNLKAPKLKGGEQSAKPSKTQEDPVTKQEKPAKKPDRVTEGAKDLTPSESTTKKGDGGAYMVMAGSYLLRENADKMVKKLKGMGYSNAEVVVFSQSQYHSVIAARYKSESSAYNASSELKRRGVDSFVKTR